MLIDYLFCDFKELLETIIQQKIIEILECFNLCKKFFFDLPVKNEEEAYEKQTKLKDPLRISFIGKILATRGATMFFIIEKSKETTFNFSQNSVTII